MFWKGQWSLNWSIYSPWTKGSGKAGVVPKLVYSVELPWTKGSRKASVVPELFTQITMANALFKMPVVTLDLNIVTRLMLVNNQPFLML
jgi:hypothetical protein